MISDAGVDGLTRILVDVITPAKLIVAMTANLNAQTLKDCAIMIGAMLLFPAIGLGYGWAATKLWKSPSSKPTTEHSIIGLSLMNNGVFLPLPILLAITPFDLHSKAALYIAAAYLTLVVLQWSLCATLLSGSDSPTLNWKSRLKPMINMPVMSILLGAILSRVPIFVDAANGRETFPFVEILMNAFTTLGQGLSPIAMLVLGMMIAQCKLSERLNLRAIMIPVFYRLLLSPLLMVGLISLTDLKETNSLLVTALVIETAMPPATLLAIIARRFGGDWETISSVMLIAYLLSLISVPFWVAIVFSG